MRRNVIGLVLLTALAVTVLAQDKGRVDEKLYGTWVTTMVRFEGKTTLIPEVELTVVFAEGGKLTVKEKGETQDIEGTFKTDQTKTTMAIDVTAPKTRGGKAETVKGIYKVEGDTLTLVLARGADENRPAGFDIEDLPVMTFKRQKP